MEENQHKFVRKERRYGSFSRSFNIANVKADAISASYQNGILELTLPKTFEKFVIIWYNQFDKFYFMEENSHGDILSKWLSE